MTEHYLTLPLPSEYGGEDGYFSFSSATPGELAPNVNRYLDDLCSFLRSTKLLQRHPDDYFDCVGPCKNVGATHLDGSEISSNEVEYVSQLCSSLSPLLPKGDADAETDLSALVRCGPSVAGEAFRFFSTTKKLMLNRSRRADDDGVLHTLMPVTPARASTMKPSPDVKKRRILELVLSRGMSAKKMHEVEAMTQSIADLVKVTDSPQVPVRTVINFGEGKGYVSRALSLVEQLQVIGLDCNPSHKEKTLERIEKVLEDSASKSQTTDTGSFNLLYEPRGYVTSVVCRVTDTVEWTQLLQDHIPVAVRGVVTYPPEANDDLNVLDHFNGKLRCKACGRVLRSSLSVLERHSQQHVERGDLPSDLLSSANWSEWHRVLPPERAALKTVNALYDLVQREREAVMVHDLCLYRAAAARGYRVKVWVSPAHCKHFFGQTVNLPHSPHDTLLHTYLTVLSYDDASHLHQVVFEGERKLLRVTLFEYEGDTGNQHFLKLLAASPPLVLVDEVIPPLLPTKSAVMVPCLSNTVMTGLHACGDLGSNVCRIFSDSSSRGLLLVSCCWHALTRSGFPLSQALKRRNFTVHEVSLLLATQPYDMWSNINTDGHRGSVKLLFFRSVLKLLWRMLDGKWRASPTSGCSCPFAPLPHLEPFFLRMAAREKHTMTFPLFFSKVLESYVREATFKKTAYTWDNHVCLQCRREQERFIDMEFPDEVLNSTASELLSTFFPSFLGVNVLRMWMSHTVESLFLLDRTLFLHETTSKGDCAGFSSAASLFPLFDGRISPRMYGICARRFS